LRLSLLFPNAYVGKETCIFFQASSPHGAVLASVPSEHPLHHRRISSCAAVLTPTAQHSTAQPLILIKLPKDTNSIAIGIPVRYHGGTCYRHARRLDIFAFTCTYVQGRRLPIRLHLGRRSGPRSTSRAAVSPSRLFYFLSSSVQPSQHPMRTASEGPASCRSIDHPAYHPSQTPQCLIRRRVTP
jgi:hypothetical protein